MASLSWSKHERTVLLLAWLGWTFDVMDAALFNFAKVPLVTELLGGPDAYKANGPTVESGLLLALMVGWSVGGILFGRLADRYGRVRVMAATVLVYSLFTGLTAFCHTIHQLMAVRFLTGLGIGGEWAAGAAWVAESVSDEKRARAASWLQSAAAFGPWFAALANVLLAAQGWRALFLVGAIPALLTVVLRYSMRQEETVAQSQTQSGAGFKGFWRPAIVGLVLGIAGIATAQNVSFWLPNLVKQLSPGLEPAALQARQSTAALVLHIGTLVGVFLVPWACTKLGRRATMLLCFIAGPVSVWLVAQFAKDFNTLLVLSPLMSLFGIGLSGAFVLYFPELFPPHLRATGAGLAYNGGRIVAALVPFLTAYLIGSQGDVGKSIAQTSVLLAAGAIALAFAPETKDKPLERTA